METIKLKDIKPNPNNPRKISKEQLAKLVNSIQEFPEMLNIRPLVINKDNVLLGGNMRLQALKELNFREVPVLRAENFTAEQEKEFIIKDNISYGDWDWVNLENDWNKVQLDNWGVVITDWGKDENKDKDLRHDFTIKTGRVDYEPKETFHQPCDLFTIETKYDEEIDLIENEDIKLLLKSRAAFFTQFNFSKIADYYAYQASAQEQRIFEKLALVLLDRDQLIINGFSLLIDDVESNEYE